MTRERLPTRDGSHLVPSKHQSGQRNSPARRRGRVSNVQRYTRPSPGLSPPRRLFLAAASTALILRRACASLPALRGARGQRVPGQTAGPEGSLPRQGTRVSNFSAASAASLFARGGTDPTERRASVDAGANTGPGRIQDDVVVEAGPVLAHILGAGSRGDAVQSGQSRRTGGAVADGTTWRHRRWSAFPPRTRRPRQRPFPGDPGVAWRAPLGQAQAGGSSDREARRRVLVASVSCA